MHEEIWSIMHANTYFLTLLWSLNYNSCFSYHHFFVFIFLQKMKWYPLIVPAERSSWGDYETGSVGVCVRPCVCLCVRPCVRVCSNVRKCYFSVISWLILILILLSDKAWWGLPNFYTELWNSLVMQIYSKLINKATLPPFHIWFWLWLLYLIGLDGGFQTSPQKF